MERLGADIVTWLMWLTLALIILATFEAIVWVTNRKGDKRD